jgi:putative transposase
LGEEALLYYPVVAMELFSNRNVVCQTAYHVVWCPKYRKPILTGRTATGLRKLLDKICHERKWRIGALEIQPDHLLLFFCWPPSVAIAKAVKILKGTTARLLFLDFPAIQQKLWNGALWSPSYYVGTAGHVSAQTIQRYIERTEHIRGRR